MQRTNSSENSSFLRGCVFCDILQNEMWAFYRSYVTGITRIFGPNYAKIFAEHYL